MRKNFARYRQERDAPIVLAFAVVIKKITKCAEVKVKGQSVQEVRVERNGLMDERNQWR